MQEKLFLKSNLTFLWISGILVKEKIHEKVFLNAFLGFN